MFGDDLLSQDNGCYCTIETSTHRTSVDGLVEEPIPICVFNVYWDVFQTL